MTDTTNTSIRVNIAMKIAITELILNELITLIDKVYGEGYAKKNPYLLAQLIRSTSEMINKE